MQNFPVQKWKNVANAAMVNYPKTISGLVVTMATAVRNLFVADVDGPKCTYIRKNQMLDLSQFAESFMGSNAGLTVGHFNLLLAECLRLQENNRELCEFLKHLNNYAGLVFESDYPKLDALIAKNQGSMK